jgi:phosphoribosyl 1,2-cyclic phosphate phosphodiesterase
MQVTFLGTGTSYGVPHIGCDCAVCTSTDAHNKRLRSSVLVEHEGTHILVDTTPDLRAQLLRCDARRLDAVLWTHWHNDHVVGVDDLRPLCNMQGYIPGYGSAQTLESLRKSFGYVFVEGREYDGFPRINITEVNAGQVLEIGMLRVTALQIQHGRSEIFAYRFEARVLAGKENITADAPVFVYATDCSAVPEHTRAAMRDADLLVLGALRHREHPAHFTVAQALEESQRLQARRTLFTHIAHDLDHEETNAHLPAGAALAYDEMIVEVA